MKNAPDITLISIAERLSREKSLFAQSQLLDLSNTQAAMQGQKSALEPSLERLTGDGFFRSGPDGFCVLTALIAGWLKLAARSRIRSAQILEQARRAVQTSLSQ